MRIKLSAKKSPEKVLALNDIGFGQLRGTVSDLVGDPWTSHYRPVLESIVQTEEFYDEFDKQTERLIKNRKVSSRIADFLIQVDVEGCIHYGACQELLKLIGNYDNDFVYGYHSESTKFCDFKHVLEECVRKKCDLVWDAVCSHTTP